VSRFRFIAAEKARHAVVRLCRVLGVSPSGFYAWAKRRPAPRTRANEALASEIRGIHARSRGTYGAPRIHAELQATGQHASRKRVARLMRIEGLVGRGRRPARRTTIPDPAAQAQDLVKREFRPSAPDRLWLADITYVRTDEGWLYLAAILDAYSRRVVGWALASHLRTELAITALRMALAARRPATGLIHHTDRGCQYTAGDYAALLTRHGIAQSLGRPGTCWDNAVAESFFATLKIELVDRYVWSTRRQAQTAIFEFIESFYNRQRRHSTLGYLPPAAFEAEYYAADSAA
jgi:transposase InsO family protein